MILTPPHPFRLGRALFVSFALVANLLATAAPLLHARAHETGDDHHEASSEAGVLEHSHDEVHPLALHDDWLLTDRNGLDFGPALPATRTVLGRFVLRTAPVVHAVLPVSSRAPPGVEQARAPPLI